MPTSLPPPKSARGQPCSAAGKLALVPAQPNSARVAKSPNWSCYERAQPAVGDALPTLLGSCDKALGSTALNHKAKSLNAQWIEREHAKIARQTAQWITQNQSKSLEATDREASIAPSQLCHRRDDCAQDELAHEVYLLGRPHCLTWGPDRWLEARQQAMSLGRFKELRMLTDAVYTSSMQALACGYYETDPENVQVDLANALSRSTSCTWWGRDNCQVPLAVDSNCEGQPPPLIVAEASCLDVALQLSCSLCADGQPQRPTYVVVEISDFTQEGLISMPSEPASGSTLMTQNRTRQKQNHGIGLSSFQPQQQSAALCTDVSRFIHEVNGSRLHPSASVREHLTAQQDPFIVTCPGVTVFRGCRDDGYAFLEKPLSINVLMTSMSQARPELTYVRPHEDALGKRTVWYSHEENQTSLLERLNLIGLAALQRSKKDPLGSVVLVLNACGCTDSGRHPRDAVANSLKHWRRRFARHFYCVIVACGQDGDLARHFDQVINQDLYKQLSQKGAQKPYASQWHWDERYLRLHINTYVFMSFGARAKPSESTESQTVKIQVSSTQGEDDDADEIQPQPSILRRPSALDFADALRESRVHSTGVLRRPVGNSLAPGSKLERQETLNSAGEDSDNVSDVSGWSGDTAGTQRCHRPSFIPGVAARKETEKLMKSSALYRKLSVSQNAAFAGLGDRGFFGVAPDGRNESMLEKVGRARKTLSRQNSNLSQGLSEARLDAMDKLSASVEAMSNNGGAAKRRPMPKRASTIDLSEATSLSGPPSSLSVPKAADLEAGRRSTGTVDVRSQIRERLRARRDSQLSMFTHEEEKATDHDEDTTNWGERQSSSAGSEHDNDEADSEHNEQAIVEVSAAPTLSKEELRRREYVERERNLDTELSALCCSFSLRADHHWNATDKRYRKEDKQVNASGQQAQELYYVAWLLPQGGVEGSDFINFRSAQECMRIRQGENMRCVTLMDHAFREVQYWGPRCQDAKRAFESWRSQESSSVFAKRNQNAGNGDAISGANLNQGSPKARLQCDMGNIASSVVASHTKYTLLKSFEADLAVDAPAVHQRGKLVVNPPVTGGDGMDEPLSPVTRKVFSSDKSASRKEWSSEMSGSSGGVGRMSSLHARVTNKLSRLSAVDSRVSKSPSNRRQHSGEPLSPTNPHLSRRTQAKIELPGSAARKLDRARYARALCKGKCAFTQAGRMPHSLNSPMLKNKSAFPLARVLCM